MTFATFSCADGCHISSIRYVLLHSYEMVASLGILRHLHRSPDENMEVSLKYFCLSFNTSSIYSNISNLEVLISNFVSSIEFPWRTASSRHTRSNSRTSSCSSGWCPFCSSCWSTWAPGHFRTRPRPRRSWTMRASGSSSAPTTGGITAWP